MSDPHGYYSLVRACLPTILLGPFLIIAVVRAMFRSSRKTVRRLVWIPTLALIWGLTMNYVVPIGVQTEVVTHAKVEARVLDLSAPLFGVTTRPWCAEQVLRRCRQLAAENRYDVVFIGGSPVDIDGAGVSDTYRLVKGLREIFPDAKLAAYYGSHDFAEGFEAEAAIYDKYGVIHGTGVWKRVGPFLVCFGPGDLEHADASGLGNDPTTWNDQLDKKLQLVSAQDRALPKILCLNQIDTKKNKPSERFAANFEVILTGFSGWGGRYSIGNTKVIKCTALGSPQHAFDGLVIFPGKANPPRVVDVVLTR